MLIIICLCPVKQHIQLDTGKTLASDTFG